MNAVRLAATLAMAASLIGNAAAQGVPSPRQFLGFNVCEDYQLANYKQLTAYWKAVDQASDRMTMVSIGKTEEGRDQWMAIISDPANLRHLEQHRAMSQRFAMARSFSTDDEARAAAAKSKAVVWIDGGLHASEVLGAQQLIETVYQLVTRSDEENKRILKDCIILVAHANPDGMDLCSDWYMRKPEPKERSLSGLPILYEKYAGHDNNRDFYASNLKETQNINKVFYSEWFPQIVYNHHQTAPPGTIMFVPPFRTPYNYNVDPLVQISTDLVGVHIHQRLIGEGKGGTVMRNAASYSTWWNGGLRTTTYFHNMIGILTETYGSPTPGEVPFIKDRQIPSTDLPDPVTPGPWHMKQSLAYELSANYAVLDYASRYRETLLFNTYRAAKNAIERGSRDSWSPYPARVNSFGAAALSRPDLRDARLYILPADQPDKGSLRWFVQRLLWTGVEVGETRKPVSIAGKRFPAGSFIVRCDQPFRSHVLDMFEPQDHPNDLQYPGGPPIPPYDSAGYTLAFQMGVQFERVLEPVDVEAPLVKELDSPPSGEMDFRDIDAFRWLNNKLKYERTVIVDGVAYKAPRVGLWDRYGGSMESGWCRFVLEKFGFDFSLTFAPDLDRGKIKDKFDVLLFPDGAVPSRDGNAPTSALAQDSTIPAELRARIGSLTTSKSVPELRQFLESGGHIVAIGSSATNLAKHLGLPIENALADPVTGRPLDTTKFYVPASVLRVKLVSCPLTVGMDSELDMMFDNSPSFKWKGSAPNDAQIVASYNSENPLRSGWALGQTFLKGTFACVDLAYGKGRIVLIGPEPMFRGQPSASFKLVFNAILRAGMER